MFWNQVLKNKNKKQKRRRRGRREIWRKKERMRAGFTGMFLNEGEKENKRRAGIEIGHWTCVWRKKTRKKEMKRMDENEMKERKNNVKNKKS